MIISYLNFKYLNSALALGLSQRAFVSKQKIEEKITKMLILVSNK